MTQRPIVTIIGVASFLIAGSGRIAFAADKAAPSQPAELGTLDGTAVLVRIGAGIDGVMLDKLDLADEVKANARQALRTWYVNEMAGDRQRAQVLQTWYVNEMAGDRQRAQAELAGADAARRVQLKQAVEDLSTPYRSAQTLASYVGAKAALKDILSAEQLQRLDSLVKAATSDMVVNHYILAVVARWGKDHVVLDADQQSRVEAIIAAARAVCEVLAAGDEVGVRRILNRLGGDLPRVLTPAQRAQTMHPTP